MSQNFIFPSLLSYCGSLKPSIGFFYAIREDNNEKKPLLVNEESIRGTHANYGAQQKETNIGSPNLQLIDRAYLPAGFDQCQITFSLNVIPNALTPHACNDKTAHYMLTTLVDAYNQKNGFHYLAQHYAENIINGRWLWRNRSLAQTFTIQVTLPDNTLTFTVNRLIPEDTIHAHPEDGKAQLAQFIADALSGKTACGLMIVTATFAVGDGQEVYPSQELPLDGEDKRGDYKKSRILAQMDNQAVLHSQKIGNALRTIDHWYPNADANYPLAVEPFGVDSVLQTAHRADSRTSFYSLLEKHYARYLTALETCHNAADLSGEDQQLHFIIACLIRGGVYSGEKKDDTKKKNKGV